MTMAQCLQDGIYVILPGTRESVFQEEPCMQRAEGLFIGKYDKWQKPGFASMRVNAPDCMAVAGRSGPIAAGFVHPVR